MDDDGREPGGPTDDSPPGPVTTELPPPEPAAPARRPLRRSASDKVIAGVAGGLAENFGVSSLAVRSLFGLAFVVIAWQVWTLLGIAIVAYVLLWIFVPREDIGVSPAGRLTRRFPRVGPAIGVLLLLAGAAAIAAQLDGWLVWPVLLIGGGVLLYRYDAGRGVPRSAAPSAPGVTPPAALPPPSVEPPPEPRAPRPPRERSPLGWLGLGIALLVVGSRGDRAEPRRARHPPGALPGARAADPRPHDAGRGVRRASPVARPARDPGRPVPPRGERRHRAARGRVREPVRAPLQLGRGARLVPARRGRHLPRPHRADGHAGRARGHAQRPGSGAST